MSVDRLKAAFHTLGCKTNHYETDAIRMQFQAAGFQLVSFKDAADVYVINTCTVTAEADRKSRQMLRRARQNNQHALVVAVGCQAVIGDAAEWADLVVDNDHKSQTCQRVVAFWQHKKQEQAAQTSDLTDWPATAAAAVYASEHHPLAAEPPQTGYDELGAVTQQSETRAYIKIEDGCNQSCSYCAIPLARGRVRSRDRSQILIEAKALAAAGFREIVLTGIHLCSYGADLGLPGHAVMALALELAETDGIERIRLGSLEPRFITPAFVELAAQNPCLCPHFHLSLQSGSDRVLSRMNRSYRTASFRSAVTLLREAFADPGLTTDVIVGFPGETAADFTESFAFCLEMGFSRMHVFRFSARRGTAAANMTDVVKAEEIANRSRLMTDLASELSERYHSRQVGRIQGVLVEKQLSNDLYTGYTPSYVPVRFASDHSPETGCIVQVRGLQASPDFLYGTQT